MNKQRLWSRLVIASASLFLAFSGPSCSGGAGTGNGGPDPDLSVAVIPNATCVVMGHRQQFTASKSDAAWSVESVNSDKVLGTVDSSGMFTAGTTPVTGKVIAKVGSASGVANIAVVSSEIDCNSVPPPPPPPPTVTTWKAVLNFNIKSPITDGETVYGNYIADGDATFCFTELSGLLTIAAPNGTAHVNYSTDTDVCTIRAINSTDLEIIGVAGTKVENNFVFGVGSIIPDHSEGVILTCNSYEWPPITNASALDTILRCLSSITVEAKNSATAVLSGACTTALDVQAPITGNITVTNTCP